MNLYKIFLIIVAAGLLHYGWKNKFHTAVVENVNAIQVDSTPKRDNKDYIMYQRVE